MKVSHHRPLSDPSLGSFHGTALCYRTTVTNTNPQPIIIWFQFFLMEHDIWYSFNCKNRVLQANDFATWYAEGDPLENGWLLPGKVAACDPNWHGGNLEPFPRRCGSSPEIRIFERAGRTRALKNPHLFTTTEDAGWSDPRW